jgi:hypothetical protein
MDITKILGYGLSGLCFLLFLLSFRLISQEQKQAQPRKSILQIIMLFMFLTLVSTVAVGWMGIVQVGKNEQLAVANKILEKNDSLSTRQHKVDEWVDRINDPEKQKGLTPEAQKDTVLHDAQKIKAVSDTIAQSLVIAEEVNPQDKVKVNEANTKIAAASEAIRVTPAKDTMRIRKLTRDIFLSQKVINEVSDKAKTARRAKLAAAKN